MALTPGEREVVSQTTPTPSVKRIRVFIRLIHLGQSILKYYAQQCWVLMASLVKRLFHFQDGESRRVVLTFGKHPN